MITAFPRVIKIFLYPILNIQEPSFMGAQLPPGPRAHPRWAFLIFQHPSVILPAKNWNPKSALSWSSTISGCGSTGSRAGDRSLLPFPKTPGGSFYIPWCWGKGPTSKGGQKEPFSTLCLSFPIFCRGMRILSHSLSTSQPEWKALGEPCAFIYALSEGFLTQSSWDLQSEGYKVLFSPVAAMQGSTPTTSILQ